MAANCWVLPKAIDALSGLTAIETRFAGAPVPFSETVCGLLLAESVKLSVPARAPVALGENKTDAVQLAPPAKVAGLMGHVEVTPKSTRLLAMDVIVRDAD